MARRIGPDWCVSRNHGERQQWRAVASTVLPQVRGNAEPDISESL
jgi:hypothetical protein